MSSQRPKKNDNIVYTHNEMLFNDKKGWEKNTAIIKWLEWKIIIKSDGPGIERQQSHISLMQKLKSLYVQN